VLDGQLAGVVASPLTGLVRGLGSMVSGLANQLQQLQEKKEKEG
jgi:ribosomal protein L10